MDLETLRAYAETRAQSDTKALKKTIQNFYALLAHDATGDKLLAAHSILSIGLDQLEQQLGKSERIDKVTAAEIQEYQQEVAALERTSEETRQKLVDLRRRLEAAQQERARRIEYDAIAKTISRLPDRQKGKETLNKLEEDIELLRQEERTYSETWQTRKLAFDGIVTSLEAMQEAIRDEKAEQERRRALDEEDDAGGGGGGGAGGSGTTGGGGGGPPPAPGSIDTGDANNTPRAGSLDPNAKPFVPGTSGAGEDGEDVEMRDEEEQEEGADREEMDRGRDSGEEVEERRDDLGGEREEGQMTDEREEGEM
ncbi:hypothetical protein JCM8115_003155 [Rhodotorula mucilaginosa]|uniref:Tho complex subunit 7 n=1 Tax=Rhodotorula mucilaginosa TaxID=5537 RepID=A0A9P6VTW8_RHOMI|nr:hypothetical protein C6P46_002333 [Rhodotorula mucilaginosa]